MLYHTQVSELFTPSGPRGINHRLETVGRSDIVCRQGRGLCEVEDYSHRWRDTTNGLETILIAHSLVLGTQAVAASTVIFACAGPCGRRAEV